MKNMARYSKINRCLKFIMASTFWCCVINYAGAEGILLDENTIKTVIETGLNPQRWQAPDWPNYKWPSGTNRWIAGEATLEINGDENGSLAEIVGKAAYSDAGSIYFGKNTLINNLDTPQKLTTSSYSKSISNSVTTSTTRGWKIGNKVTVKGGIEIPFISKGEVAVEVSGEYNSSSTDSKTITTVETYTIPPQTIELKPHEEVIVSVYLAQSRATGKYRSYQYANGNASVPFRSFTDKNIPSYWQSTNSIYNYLKYSSWLPGELIGITDDQIKKIKVFSEGSFVANAGVEFNVVITPVDRVTGKVKTTEAIILKAKPLNLKNSRTAGSGIRFW